MNIEIMNDEHINSHFCKCFVEVHVRDLFDNQEKKEIAVIQMMYSCGHFTMSSLFQNNVL